MKEDDAGPSETSIRFWCGALFGAFVGVYLAIGWFDEETRTIVLCIVVASVLSGYLAVKYGDRFWNKIIDSWPWWI